ncbi:hypothetical protein [Gracilibacillus sp. YIM 98692]|uniref:hypothetical protein n=1 Tax=Gracilibacillus sp. YIM 98692 TaxID=2663532 RepID=UPI0013D5AA8D|nr:hypothetical protein [Gracilibacillus sp. YIM 98692]
MHSATLANQKIVSAREYHAEVHGSRLYCMDKSCHVPVIFVPGNEEKTPHFKTTGKNDSKHVESYGFYKPLSFIETIQKVEEYQEDFLKERGMKENIVRLNFNKLDPDYEPKTVDRDPKQQKKEDTSEIKIKAEQDTPNSITSLSSLVKLMTSSDPDILSSIIVSIKGKKIPIYSLIINQEEAHEKVWHDEIISNVGYFVFGEIDKVLRREKVMYINFKPVNQVLFSLVIFDQYFKYFSYTDDELIGKNVLAWGHLRKNTYQDKNTTEMAIKSDKYIEFLK